MNLVSTPDRSMYLAVNKEVLYIEESIREGRTTQEKQPLLRLVEHSHKSGSPVEHYEHTLGSITYIILCRRFKDGIQFTTSSKNSEGEIILRPYSHPFTVEWYISQQKSLAQIIADFFQEVTYLGRDYFGREPFYPK